MRRRESVRDNRKKEFKKFGSFTSLRKKAVSSKSATGGVRVHGRGRSTYRSFASRLPGSVKGNSSRSLISSNAALIAAALGTDGCRNASPIVQLSIFELALPNKEEIWRLTVFKVVDSEDISRE